jgi:uncharacterized membrane protein YqgA involved in biofilm formation
MHIGADLAANILQFIIVGLIVIVGWFIRREFANFEKTLNTMCNRLHDKADKAENEKDHDFLWQRVDHHKHADSGEVIIK